MYITVVGRVRRWPQRFLPLVFLPSIIPSSCAWVEPVNMSHSLTRLCYKAKGDGIVTPVIVLFYQTGL